MSDKKAKSCSQERFLNSSEPYSFKKICEKICAKEALSTIEITTLADASLPQLLKCVEIAKTNYSFKPIRLKAAFFVPINKLIADKGKEFAIEVTTTLIQRMAQTLESDATLYFKIDTWIGATPFETLLDALDTILQISSSSFHIAVIPPNIDELTSLWHSTNKSLNQYFSRELFSQLCRIGIQTIIGDTQHQILSIAATHGCNLSIRSKLTCASSMQQFCITLLKSHSASYRQKISSLALIVDDMIQLRLNPTIAFRAVATTRLLFTEVDYIGIDVSLFDPALVRLAAQFGANDFGYAGIDNHTASSLNIPTLSDTEKITGIALAHPAICSYKPLAV